MIRTSGGCETKKGSVEERRRPLEVVERSFRDLPASTGPVQKASLDEVGFVDVLEGAPVFLNSGVVPILAWSRSRIRQRVW